MDAIGCAIAELLPTAYRGAYAAATPGLERARQHATAIFGAPGSAGEA